MAAETTTPAASAAQRAWDALSRARVLLFSCDEQPARAELLAALDEARTLVAELTPPVPSGWGERRCPHCATENSVALDGDRPWWCGHCGRDLEARTIYIAGPMRGYPEHNFPAFHAAAERFRAAGWAVRNPVDIGAQAFGNDPTVPGGAYLRADLRAICDVDAIALLPGWERSTGARCEVVVALTIGLPFHDALTREPIGPPSRVVCDGGYERPPGAVDSLDALADEIRAWQRATFPRATPHSVTEHLRREAIELSRAPEDAEEIADVFLLTIGAANAAGHDLVPIVRAKLETNKARTWGQPDEHGVVEHVREPAEASHAR